MTEATGMPLGPDPSGRDAYLWAGTANGVTVEFYTNDPALKPLVQPILTDTVMGVRLVDAAGRELASQFYLKVVSAPQPEPEPDPDELLESVRKAASRDDVHLDAFELRRAVRALDELLSSGRVSLPADWTHCEYSDE